MIGYKQVHGGITISGQRRSIIRRVTIRTPQLTAATTGKQHGMAPNGRVRMVHMLLRHMVKMISFGEELLFCVWEQVAKFALEAALLALFANWSCGTEKVSLERKKEKVKK